MGKSLLLDFKDINSLDLNCPETINAFFDKIISQLYHSEAVRPKVIKQE